MQRNMSCLCSSPAHANLPTVRPLAQLRPQTQEVATLMHTPQHTEYICEGSPRSRLALTPFVQEQSLTCFSPWWVEFIGKMDEQYV